MAKNEGKIAKRYAKALFELCKPEELDVREAALKQIAFEISHHKDLLETLRNPGIPNSQKVAVLQGLVQLVSANDGVLSNFISIVLDQGRILLLDTIVTCFSQLIIEFKKIFNLQVTSAFTLSDQERTDLQRDIQQGIPAGYAQYVTLNWKQDSELIGGLKISSGDKVVDATVSGALSRLAQEMI